MEGAHRMILEQVLVLYQALELCTRVPSFARDDVILEESAI